MTEIRFYTLMTIGWATFIVAVIIIALVFAPSDISDDFPSGAIQPSAVLVPPFSDVGGHSDLGARGRFAWSVHRLPDPITNRYRFKLGKGKISKIGESPFKNSFDEMSFKPRTII